MRQFERRCQIGMAAGRWWMDQNGNLGPVGGPATYNINTCQELEQDARMRPAPRPTDRCTFFPGQGSICSGPGFHAEQTGEGTAEAANRLAPPGSRSSALVPLASASRTGARRSLHRSSLQAHSCTMIRVR